MKRTAVFGVLSAAAFGISLYSLLFSEARTAIAQPYESPIWRRNGPDIYNSNPGNVGIGTSTPSATLSVEGMIESRLHGFKFPDGTVQTSAAAGLGQYSSGLDSFRVDSWGDRSVMAGFAPRRVRITVVSSASFSGGGGGAHSIGTATSPTEQHCIWLEGPDSGSGPRLARVRLQPSGSVPEDLLFADLLSIDASGFTIRWSITDAANDDESIHVLWEAYE